MKKGLVLVLILLAIIGLTVVVFLNTRDNATSSDEVENATSTNASVTVRGEVGAVDDTQIASDGPLFITLETTEGEEAVISVPSSGIRLCAAYESIVGASRVEVGQTLEVRGKNTSENIVPCSGADHFVRIVSGGSQGTLGLEEVENINGLSITLIDIKEDSRCPVDAQCVQAGEVIARVRLASENKDELAPEGSLQNISSNEAARFGAYRVSIQNVTPTKSSETEISKNKYQVTFIVERADGEEAGG